MQLGNNTQARTLVRTSPISVIVGSALLSLASCTSAKPDTVTPDLARLRAIAAVDFDGRGPTVAEPQGEAAPETPRRGHTHPDTPLHAGDAFEAEPADAIAIELVEKEHHEGQGPNGDSHRRHHRHRRHERPYRHPREGFYVGGNFGLTDGNDSGGKLENDLNRRTPAGRDVNVSLDDTDLGFKAFVGYRFNSPFAIEVGFTSLEGPDSNIDTPVVDGNLIADVRELHPLTGRGPTASFLAIPFERDRLSTFAKLGFWYWEADIDVRLGNTSVKNDPNGWDFIAGLGAQYRMFDELSARLEYERYFLDDNGVDMLSIGLTYRF